jgi:ApeA N-terminal domain 1
MADEDRDVVRWMGVFALGRDDEDMAAGELSYHPRAGISVRTLDWVQTAQPFGRNATRKYPSLKGLIEGNRNCTVLHAFETNVSGGRLEQSHLVGNAILLDGWCDDPAAPVYRQMRFCSPAFTALANPHSINVNLVSTKRRRRFTAKGEPRKPIRGKWGIHKLVFSSVLNVPPHQAWDGTYNITERPYLEFQFGELVSFNEVRRITAALEFFACVSDGEFSGPPEVLLWTDSFSNVSNTHNAPANAAQVLLSESWYRSVQARHPFERLFVLDILGPKPLTQLAQWLELSERIKHLMSLYRAAIEVPNIETKFLFLIQCIEGLHRALDDHPSLDSQEFDRGTAAMKAAIPADLSKDARRFLGDRVPRHNEPSLGSRLKEYGARITQIAPNALPKFSKDRQTIKNLRDEFSHALHGNHKRSVEERGREILYYCEVLRLLFEFNLLHHLHVSDLKSIFENNRRFKNLARQRSDLIPSSPPKPRRL